MTPPTLVVVSGPPASGKTTLAHALAREIGCPAICRDELKEGLVYTHRAREQEWRNANERIYAAFFDTIELLLDRGISLVAEAAFQQALWAKRLQPLDDRAGIRLIGCQADPGALRARIAERLDTDPRRGSHQDRQLLTAIDAGRVSLAAHEFIRLSGRPHLLVDTTDGYRPEFGEIVAFARDAGGRVDPP